MTHTDSDRFHPLWIGGSCFMAYASCYIGKNILSALMPQMISENVLSNTALGMMGSAFLLAYGIGQFVNGMLGNYISPKYMVFFGLFFSGTIIALFPLCSSAAVGAVLWGICGFLSSMLWGPLSRVVGENTEPKTGKLILSLLTVASMVGTLIAYVLAVLSSVTHSYRTAFFIGGGLVAAMGLLWLFLYTYLASRKIIQPAVSREQDGRSKISTFFSLFLRGEFVCMVLVTMLNGVIRNAVSFWIPTFLSQYLGIATEFVAAVSVILPLVNIGGTFFSLFAVRFVKNNEKIMCVFLFALASVLFGALFFCPPTSAVPCLILLFSGSAAMAGVCNMIFSPYVLRFKSEGTISGITGFFDFSSYMSASLASLTFTQILQKGSWHSVILFWVAVTVLGALLSLVATRLKPAAKEP